MGRPSKLESEPGLADAILEDIRETGIPPKIAAGAHGVSRQVWEGWERRAAEGAEPYHSFLSEVARACDLAEVQMVRELRRLPVTERGTADGAQARALQWALERLRSETYGQRIDVRVRGEALKHVLTRLREGLDPATLARVLAVLADDSGEGVAVGPGAHTH